MPQTKKTKKGKKQSSEKLAKEPGIFEVNFVRVNLIFLNTFDSY